jgi:hypothetical protein
MFFHRIFCCLLTSKCIKTKRIFIIYDDVVVAPLLARLPVAVVGFVLAVVVVMVKPDR